MKLLERSLGRSVNSVRNALFSLLFFILSILASFIGRTVFIQCLGAEYLGVRGLLTSLLDFLSLAELGVGSAVSYALYKPLLQGDTVKMKALLRTFRKCYYMIGTVILFLGMALVPFLTAFMKEIPVGIPMHTIRICFMLYTANTAISFFLSHKRILIVCDQRGYLSEISGGIAKLVLTALQIAVLIITRSFLLYLVVMILCTTAECLVISGIANRLYPFARELREAEQLNDGERRELRNNVAAILMHKIGTVIVFSSDNLIISRFVGIVTVGLYSNYSLLISSVGSMIQRIFWGSTASMGNLMAGEDTERGEKAFFHMLFLNSWLSGWAAVGLLCLTQPLIRLWLGASYVMDPVVLVIAVLCFYFTNVRITVLSFKDAAGVFRQDWFKPLIESAVNITVSIPLAIRFGIAGVLAGTVISMLTVAFWYEAKVFFRDRFHQGIRKYLWTQVKYFGINLLISGICFGLIRIIPLSGDENLILVFLMRLCVCMVVPNGIYTLCFRKSEEMAYFRELIRRFLFRRKAGGTETNGMEGR